MSLKVNEKKIEEIKKALEQKKEVLKQLEKKTKSEYKDVAALQRSRTKRLFLRLKAGNDGRRFCPKGDDFMHLINVRFRILKVLKRP